MERNSGSNVIAMRMRYEDACATQAMHDDMGAKEEPWSGLMTEAQAAVVFNTEGVYSDKAVAIALSHPFCSSAIQREILNMEMP